MKTMTLLLAAAISLAAAPAMPQSPVASDALPLVAHYAMEPDAGQPKRLVDSSPSGLHGTLTGDAADIDGHAGKALRFTGRGESGARVANGGPLARLSHSWTLSAWVRFDPGTGGGFIAKRAINVSTPWSFSVQKEGQLGWEGNDGQDWANLFTNAGAAPKGEWFHYAFTYATGSEARVFVNGRRIAARAATRALATNDQPLVLGSDPFRGPSAGALDDVRLYAVALTPEQVQADMAGTLRTRAVADTDFPAPTHPVTMALVRWDTPIGGINGFGRTRRIAERVPGPDAVDWPSFTLDGKPLWEKSASERRDLILRDGAQARPLFRQPYDQVIEPGGHWVRALQWIWGRRYVYTTDPVARTWHNDYELWAFPVRIQGDGEGDVRDVVLTCGGKTIYRSAGPYRSLTLLLPQNEKGTPYELSIGGKGPVRFDAGLQPVVPGAPREVPIPVDLTVPGTPVRVVGVDRPAAFPYAKEWDADRAAMAAYGPVSLSAMARPGGLSRYLGIEVPRSPLFVDALALPHGMSGGAFFSASDHMRKFEGDEAQFAALVSDTGYDRIFERSASLELASALGARGVGFGHIPDTAWRRPFLTQPNVAFFSYTLPDYHGPLFRDLQLTAQRMSGLPNFAGISIGADNGGYVSYWDWAPPIPDRPWGEAFRVFNGEADVPLPRHLGGTASVRDFVAYLDRFDRTFEQYGYFTRAVREVDDRLPVTTGSFGSAPGVGARGGWPWATIPGKPIYSRMPVQTAYDWNELSTSKPMHLPALIDRLRSYDPKKPTWAIVDDFKLFFGREARQRAYALALTRGVQAIGTTFLANTTGPEAKPEVVAQQKELYAWLHRFGGVYAMTEPKPVVGVLYVHPQALLRRVVQDENAPDSQVARGSHEGKTTEALFLCHAAGWPAKIVTPEELRRGLPAGMKALLLVGLNRFDDSWAWFDGLEKELKAFAAAGGRILLDDESAVPAGIPAATTGMTVRAYHPQSDTDIFPLLLARNRENIGALRSALAGIAAPVAVSDDPTIWAVPTVAGDVEYVTAVNWGYEEGKNASQVVRPQTGTLRWSTSRPIYDLRLGRRIAPEEAAKVDLTRDGFRFYALPPAAVTAPSVAARPDGEGFYTAVATVGKTHPMTGVPVEFTVRRGAETATVYGASGRAIRLPLRTTEADDVTVTAKELLSGTVSAAVRLPLTAPVPSVRRDEPLRAFLDRKNVPLTIALTDAQAKDPATAALATRLRDLLAKQGRQATIGRAEPGGAVLSLQPFSGSVRFPRWRTTDTDLVLLGTPRENLLLFDQERAGLLPAVPAPGSGIAHVTYSPFAAEYRCLNLIASDVRGLEQAISRFAPRARR